MTLSLPLDPVGPDEAVWSVSELNAAVRGLLDREFGPVWVRGEVTSFKAYASGHWYFTLQDAGAQLRCAMWKTHALRAGRPPGEGTEVFALGQPGLWEEKGEFRFAVTRLLGTAMQGRQQLEFARVKEALARDGLLDAARKRSLPAFPRVIALVTSPDGAALRDLVRVARLRWPPVRLLLLPARVQGVEAVPELVAALRRVGRTDADLCIVGRGGGAREDLGAFNDEQVCRALAAVPVPTISAVGHETDVSLADLVADVRAATPSMAAQLALPDHREVSAAVRSLALRLSGGLTRRTRLLAERLARSADRLEGAMQGRLDERRHRLERLGAQLEALSPLRVLERGYALPLAPEGGVLRGVTSFPPGRRFLLRLADGTVTARAEEA
ncbi:MAG: exodeoxyribonuclease VII large subunit [Gemmatimonadales bacterium]|nr:exodeoxyribonuclease VII large subunit [Gemmatimonadales bacterium]